MNDDNNYFHKYYAPFLLSNIHEHASTGGKKSINQNEEFSVRKVFFWIHY